MGIHGLTKLISDHAPDALKEQKIDTYLGRKIAIDASMSIYQFLIAVRQAGGEGQLTNETRCLMCDTITSRDESFFDLSLEIEQNSSVSAKSRRDRVEIARRSAPRSHRARQLGAADAAGR